MKAAVITIKNHPLTFYALLSGIFISLGLYMYCINMTVRNAVSRNNTENKVLAIQNKVSDLEYQYMTKSNSVTMQSAQDLGLVELPSKIFISKHPSGNQLSFNR